MNVIDNAALKQNIEDGIAKAQASGLVLEDHIPAIVDAAVDAELAKLKDILEGVILPVLAGFADLNKTFAQVISEYVAWGDIFRGLNLSPQTIPKQGG